MSESSEPERIGRYRVLGRLATGGMAEVMLGHLSGPSGFERPVVIKRILPHIASQARFRAMFLDEARLAAMIQHPNVVAHLELGESDDGLFLVMEYLAGEPLSIVRRRAHARGMAIAPELAAHIVAEACAGLHAAHELVDADGVPQGLVHRDVSPQNLFLGYDGVVKVIDFGVALAADRMTETESGVIKGKLEYMSPEQARAETVDRRSDIFSLGVVLYELITGRRLFKRRTQAGTLRAVLEERPPRPSEIAPCSRELEAVCMKALAADRNDRFATALEMRKALKRALANDALPEETIAALMRTLFLDRIEEKRELVRKMRSGEPVVLPEIELDVEIELPAMPEPKPRARSRGFWLSAAVLVAVAAGAATLAFALNDGETASARIEDTPRAAITAPREVATPHATIVVESQPPALLTIDGATRGTTPLTLELPLGEALQATLAADGYSPHTFSIDPSTDQRMNIVLTAIPHQEPPRPRPARPRPRPNADPSWENTRF